MAKTRVPDALRIWIEARHRYNLTHAQVQMARDLGMNPKKFGSLANHRQEPWKLPLPQFIESLYLERFHKALPDTVISVEERAREMARKKAERRERKLRSP